MPNFTESLTVEIKANSSDFQRELQSVIQKVTDLQSQLNSLGHFNSLQNSIQTLISPLEQVSQSLGQIAGQISQINQTPVSLDVSSAIQGLSQLNQMAQITSRQIQSVSSASAASPLPTGSGSPTSPGESPAMSTSLLPTFSSGGMVKGPAGTDRIPAMLSAGEYVMKEASAKKLGYGLLQQINQAGSIPRSFPLTQSVAAEMLGFRQSPQEHHQRGEVARKVAETNRFAIASAAERRFALAQDTKPPLVSGFKASPWGLSGLESIMQQLFQQRTTVEGRRSPAAVSDTRTLLNSAGSSLGNLHESVQASETSHQTTTNNFGGFTIHVGEAADVNQLIRDLRLQGVRRKNRRG